MKGCFIENMKKPANCAICPFVDSKRYNYDYYCTRTKKKISVEDAGDGTAKFCPIKEREID